MIKAGEGWVTACIREWKAAGLIKRVACEVLKWMLLIEMHLFISSVHSEAKQYQGAGQQEMTYWKINHGWNFEPWLGWEQHFTHADPGVGCPGWRLLHTNVPCSFQHHTGVTAGSGSSACLVRWGKQEWQSEQGLKWKRVSNIQVLIGNITPSIFSSAGCQLYDMSKPI